MARTQRIEYAADAELRHLLQLVDESYERKAWHGPNLRGSLRGIDAVQAAWRPAAGRHNIWEIAVHAAYWKYTVWRRLTGEKRGSFPRPGSNWFERPAGLSSLHWKADLKLLADVHCAMRSAVAALAPEALHATPRGAKVSPATLIRGIAMHDVYHAGQVQLLKRLSQHS
jgi:uncharacterized damage-inducible protein DinB